MARIPTNDLSPRCHLVAAAVVLCLLILVGAMPGFAAGTQLTLGVDSLGATDGTLVATGTSFKVEVTSVASSGAAVLAYLTRVHWDSSVLYYVPCSLVLPSSVPVPENLSTSSADSDPCNHAVIENDTADYDDDPSTDKYMLLFWDNAWAATPADLPTALLDGVAAFGNLVYEIELAIAQTDSGVNNALLGDSTQVNTSGGFFPFDAAGGDSLTTGSLTIEAPKTTLTSVPKASESAALACPPSDFVAQFDATIDLAATSELDGEASDDIGVCAVTLRWFWNSAQSSCAGAAGGCSTSSNCVGPQLASDLTGITAGEFQVRSDSSNLDKDHQTDTYLEVGLQGDFSLLDSTPSPWASLAMMGLPGGGDAAVNVQAESSALCAEGATQGYPQMAVSEAGALDVAAPSATATSTATGPAAALAACPEDGDCPTFDIDTQWSFDASGDWPAPTSARLTIYYNESKVVFQQDSAPSAGSGWHYSGAAVSDDTDDGDDDPLTNKQVQIGLDDGSFDCSGSECSLATASLLEGITFETTRQFLFGDTKLNMDLLLFNQGVELDADPACTGSDTGDCVTGDDDLLSVTVEGPPATLYSAGPFTVVGPETGGNDIYYVGLATADEDDFVALIEVSGSAACSPSAGTEIGCPEMSDPSGTATPATLTLTGTLTANLPVAGSTGLVKKLLCGTVEFDTAAGSATSNSITGAEGCDNGTDEVTSFLYFAGVNVNIVPTAVTLETGSTATGGPYLQFDGDFQVQSDSDGNWATVFEKEDLMVFKSSGADIGKFSLDLNKDLTIPAGPLKIKLSSLGGSYDGSKDEFTLTGKATVSFIGSSSGDDSGGGETADDDDAFSITVDFADDGGHISIGEAGTDVDGTVMASDITLGGGFSLNNLQFSLDTAEDAYAGGGCICFPDLGDLEAAGLDTEALASTQTVCENADKGGLCFGLDLGFAGGKLNSFAIDFVFEDPGIPLGDTGAFFKELDIAAEGLSNVTETTPAFMGEVRFTAGESIKVELPKFLGGEQEGALITLILDGCLGGKEIQATGTAYLVSKVLAAQKDSATLNWGTASSDACGSAVAPGITLVLTESVLDGLLSAELGANLEWPTSADSDWELALLGDATVAIPKAIPVIGGDALASGGMFLKYVESKSSESLLAAWGELDYLFGSTEAGFQVTFDGSWETIGAGTISSYKLPTAEGGATTAAAASFDVASAPPWAAFSAAWEELAGAIDFELVDPAGTTYTAAEIATSTTMKLMTDDGSPTRLTVVVDSPTAGDWTLKLPDTTPLGALSADDCPSPTTGSSNGSETTLDNGVCFSALAGMAAQQEIVSLTSTTDAASGALTLHYQLAGHGDDSVLDLFRDSDAAGLDGRRVATVAGEDLDGGSLTLEAASLPAGDHHYYAVVHGGGHVPRALYATPSETSTQFTVPPVNIAASGDTMVLLGQGLGNSAYLFEYYDALDRWSQPQELAATAKEALTYVALSDGEQPLLAATAVTDDENADTCLFAWQQDPASGAWSAMKSEGVLGTCFSLGLAFNSAGYNPLAISGTDFLIGDAANSFGGLLLEASNGYQIGSGPFGSELVDNLPCFSGVQLLPPKGGCGTAAALSEDLAVIGTAHAISIPGAPEAIAFAYYDATTAPQSGLLEWWLGTEAATKTVVGSGSVDLVVVDDDDGSQVANIAIGALPDTSATSATSWPAAYVYQLTRAADCDKDCWSASSPSLVATIDFNSEEDAVPAQVSIGEYGGDLVLAIGGSPDGAIYITSAEDDSWTGVQTVRYADAVQVAVAVSELGVFVSSWQNTSPYAELFQYSTEGKCWLRTWHFTESRATPENNSCG